MIQITPTLLNLWLGDLGVGRAQVCRATDFHRIFNQFFFLTQS